jgi:hypothetical protein
MNDPIPAELLNELTTLRSHIQILMNEVAAVRHPLATEDRLQTPKPPQMIFWALRRRLATLPPSLPR